MISVSVRLSGRLSLQDSVMTVSALKADGTKQAAKSRTVPKLWMNWAQLQTTAFPGIIIRPSPKRFQKSTKSCSHQGLWSCQVRTPVSVGSLLISQIFLIIHNNGGTTTLQWFCFCRPGVSFPPLYLRPNREQRPWWEGSAAGVHTSSGVGRWGVHSQQPDLFTGLLPLNPAVRLTRLITVIQHKTKKATI